MEGWLAAAAQWSGVVPLQSLLWRSQLSREGIVTLIVTKYRYIDSYLRAVSNVLTQLVEPSAQA